MTVLQRVTTSYPWGELWLLSAEEGATDVVVWANARVRTELHELAQQLRAQALAAVVSAHVHLCETVTID
jgi:hypothetical protein